MNSVTALMLSRTIEETRRSEIERRPHRLMTAEPMRRTAIAPRSWTLRLPRFGFAGSKA